MALFPAKSEGLCFNNKTSYMEFYEAGEPVGMVEWMEYKNKIVYKNDYVVPTKRGRGIYRAMFDARERHLNTNKPVEATCTSMSINHYIANGFKIIKKYKRYTKVRRESV